MQLAGRSPFPYGIASRWSRTLSCASLALPFSLLFAAEPAKSDARYPFRTDSANAHLPWYQPEPLEFPPQPAAHRVGGEVVALDFIHRSGQFRASQTGELMAFTLPPYGAFRFLNAEADLREIPLHTFFHFGLLRDEDGKFTRLVVAQDQFTLDAAQGFTYRLKEVRAGEGKLLTTKQHLANRELELGPRELLVKPATRCWKNGQPATLADLKSGDALLFNLAGQTQGSLWCTDIWVGEASHQAASEAQRKKFAEFTQRRGVPGWIEHTQGNEVTLTFFSSDPAAFRASYGEAFTEKKGLRLCVANEELRTWNPPVDGEQGGIIKAEPVAAAGYGSSGLRITARVSNMLEGFRRGRVVRVFPAGVKAQDQFFGESLMGYGYGKLLNRELAENPAKEYPEQFPFRTDFGNRTLPWYQLQPGKIPPPFAEHLVRGELLSVDAAAHTGTMRPEGSQQAVAFTLLPQGAVKYLNAAAKLSDLPLHGMYRFALFQDAKGAFTQASQVCDEFTRQATNQFVHRVEGIQLEEGKLLVAQQLPLVKDYNGDMQRPPDIGRCELRVNEQTRGWQGEQQVKLAELKIGDELLVNLAPDAAAQAPVCTDVWIGAATHQLATERQAKKLSTTAQR